MMITRASKRKRYVLSCIHHYYMCLAGKRGPILYSQFCKPILWVCACIRKSGIVVREYGRDFLLDRVWKSKVFFSVEIDDLCLVDVRTAWWHAVRVEHFKKIHYIENRVNHVKKHYSRPLWQKPLKEKLLTSRPWCMEISDLMPGLIKEVWKVQMRSILLHSLLGNEVKVISRSSILAYKYKKKCPKKNFCPHIHDAWKYYIRCLDYYKKCRKDIWGQYHFRWRLDGDEVKVI